ncbi:MAG: metalloregulator ArsR/SmtB family transcription factor [Chloroflexota bacterium]
MAPNNISKQDIDVFTAIAHPVRREILEILASGDRTAGELTAPFEVSRSAVSQHLSLLVDAGLIERRRQGRKQLYQIQPDNLNEVYRWIQQFEAFWAERLDNLGQVLDEIAQNEAEIGGDSDEA